MTIAANKKISAHFVVPIKSKEGIILLLLCLLAAVHVFIYSAAFPFFNNVDEPWHFDLTVKYAQGHVPRGLEPVSTESAYYLTVYNSMAYLGKTNTFPNGHFPQPLWTQPPESIPGTLQSLETFWSKQPNYECSQAPLYYFSTGIFWDLEKHLGFSGRNLIYSVRFLNVAFIVILVWLGYVATRIVFPESSLLKLAVPALMASMPQTAFYSIDNDILSPICYGIVFICLLLLICGYAPNIKLGLLFGMAFAATFLTKTTNLPLLGVAVIVIAITLWRALRAGKFTSVNKFMISGLMAAALPVAGWCVWCKNHFGDLTGSRLKVEYFGWTLKPFAEWWQHPIFSLQGLWTYLSGQLTTFWRGEFMWHREPLASPTIDMIYIILSVIFLSTAVIAVFSKLSSASPSQKQTVWTAFAIFASGIIFFAFLSIIYDFHNCMNPSREYPFFMAGRMILGVLIPFLLLFAYGFVQLLKPIKKDWPKFLILCGLVCFMLISEAIINSPVFQNEFNWFHAAQTL
jgi:hypothetical protein